MRNTVRWGTFLKISVSEADNYGVADCYEKELVAERS